LSDKPSMIWPRRVSARLVMPTRSSANRIGRSICLGSLRPIAVSPSS
jgi:hypothetical protein